MLGPPTHPGSCCLSHINTNATFLYLCTQKEVAGLKVQVEGLQRRCQQQQQQQQQ